MTSGHLVAFLRQLRSLASVRETAALSDRHLLERFTLGRDEAAFAALLRRHGDMVWGVCRRVLADSADADDAFQATFLVLIHKAATLRGRASLAGWLQSVAWRLAHKVKAQAARRRLKEGQAETKSQSDFLAEIERRDLRVFLDAELDRLPEKYRAPLVLCYLEGLSYTEAARQLGWRDGTVCGRLARARELLRQRLSRRGLTLSGAALVTALTESSSAPAATITAAARMATLFALGQTAGSGVVSAPVATLAQGALQAMSMAKVKTMAVLVVLLGLFAAGTGWTAHWVFAIAGRDTGVVLPMQGVPSANAREIVEQTAPQKWQGHGADADAKLGSEGGRPTLSLRGHRERVVSVAYSPDGLWIATAGWDGTARVWDARTGKEVRRLDVPATKNYNPAKLLQILFSPDNQFVVVAQLSGPKEPGVIVWNRRTGERVRDFPGLCAAITPDGKQIACGGWGAPDPNRGDIRLYEFATGKLVRVLHTPYSRIDRLTFAPDGQTLFAQVGIPRPPLGKGIERLGRDGAQVRAWDAATGKERRTGLEGAWNVHQIAFSPDGRTLALASSLREIATGGQRAELIGHTNEVCTVAFAVDGRTLATGSMDGTVRLWDLPSGKEIARFGNEVPQFAGHGWVLAVAFSPDGRTLVSGGLDQTAYLWDVSRITGRRREPAERSPADLETDWKDLSGDAAAGYAAVGRLLSSPRSAVPFLEKQLERTKPVNIKRIERLIADLDDEKFAIREQATRELESLAERAAPALRKALAGKPSLEVRRRLETLLERLEGAKLLPETVRQIRAVEALEAIGSPEARWLLDKLAAGPAETWLTQEAKAAAGRLAKRASVAP